MAVVTLRTFWQSLGDTGEKELSGLLEATPWAGRSVYVYTDGEKVVVGGRTKVQICDSVPETTIELKPTEGKFAWKLSLTLTNYSKTIERFVEIPDVDNIDWEDLVDVDPITYEPTPENAKSWEIAQEDTLNESKNYTNSRMEEILMSDIFKQYIDGSDEQTLNESKNYTNSRMEEILMSDIFKQYIDGGDEQTLNDAKAYTNERLEGFEGGGSGNADEALRLAKEYTDEAIAPIMEEITRLSELSDQPLLKVVEVDGETEVSLSHNTTYELFGSGNVILSGQLGVVGSLVSDGSSITVNGEGVPESVVAHRLTSGWRVLPVGGTYTPPETPEKPQVSVTSQTLSSVTVTWTLASGASYVVRLDGGSEQNVGAVSSYTFSGLRSSQAGIIEVASVVGSLKSEWSIVEYQTLTPGADALRFSVTDPATIIESGNATTGWIYTFNGAAWGSGAHSGTKKLSATTDGYVQVTITDPNGTGQGLRLVQTPNAQNNNGVDGTGYGATISAGKYVPASDPPVPPTNIEAQAGDILRVSRTGFTLWSRVSRDGGATWIDIGSRTSTIDGVEANSILYASLIGTQAVLSNTRGAGFA